MNAVKNRQPEILHILHFRFKDKLVKLTFLYCLKASEVGTIALTHVYILTRNHRMYCYTILTTVLYLHFQDKILMLGSNLKTDAPGTMHDEKGVK